MTADANNIETTIEFDIANDSNHLRGANIQTDYHISADCFIHSL